MNGLIIFIANKFKRLISKQNDKILKKKSKN